MTVFVRNVDIIILKRLTYIRRHSTLNVTYVLCAMIHVSLSASASGQPACVCVYRKSMYAGPLASVIFQKRFPDQKQGEKKSHCAINRENMGSFCIGLYTFHHICIHMQINLKNQIFLSKLILKLSIYSTKC